MIHKPIDEITKDEIDALIENEVAEGRQIEYKLELPGNSDKDKREFLADVSSFANAAGGDLLYGVEEDEGVPKAAPGLAGINVDAEILRLNQIHLAGIDPRIPGVQIEPVDGFEDGPVLVVRVPDSWASPHMVTFKNLSRFFSRTSAGKYQLDVREIRAAFALSDALPERVRRFRDDRLAKIVADETPVSIEAPSRVVLHVVPLRAFTSNAQLEPQALEQHCSLLRPIRGKSNEGRYNIDGYLRCSRYSNSNMCMDYCQAFRNGIIEAVDTAPLKPRHDGSKTISWDSFRPAASDTLRSHLDFLERLDVLPPVLVFLTLIGVQGYSMATSVTLGAVENSYIDRDFLLLPDVMIDDFGCDVPSVLRPIFDALWNAAGSPSCPDYGEYRNSSPTSERSV